MEGGKTMKNKKTVICQKWLESERNWGSRPNGYSPHLNEEDKENYIQEYWNGMPDEVPDEYSAPDGTSYLCDVDQVYTVVNLLPWQDLDNSFETTIYNNFLK